nr:hypothetical protein [Tanacetum cinerariifolium]
MQQDQVFVMGENDEQPVDKEVTKVVWFKKPKRPLNLDLDWYVYSRRRIIAVTRLTIMKKYDYGHLEEIERVEDLQLGVKSYQKKLNLTKPDAYRSNLRNKTAYTSYSGLHGIIYMDSFKRKRLMRTDELYKFSDGMLNDVRTALHDITAGIRMEYLPMRKWKHHSDTKVITMKMEILLEPTSNKLLVGSIHIDQRGTVVISTIFNEVTKTLSSISNLNLQLNRQQSIELLHVLMSGYQLDCSEHMVIPDIVPIHLVSLWNRRIL